MSVHIVLIHEEPNLRYLLGNLLRGWTKERVEVEEAGYDVRLPSVWQRWMNEADLFILGLDRRYDAGTRAEGVKVAEHLARCGKRVLVVGSEAVGDMLPACVYWDIGSTSTFLEAVSGVLRSRISSPTDVERLVAYFGNRLEIPTGH
jgi:hypothetical protein